MASVRVKRKPVYIPEMVWDEVLRLHAAVDGETGHLICHHYVAGLTIVAVNGESHPVLALSDCTFIALGEQAVEALKRNSDEAKLEAFTGDHAVIGGVRVEATAVALAIASTRDTKSLVEFRRLTDEVEGKERQAAMIIFRNPEGEGAWALVTADCSEPVKKEKDSFYI